MEPNNPSTNSNPSAMNLNFRQPMDGAQGVTPVPMSGNSQRLSMVPQECTTNGSIGQNMISMPNYIVVLTRICLVLGVITLLGTALGLGLFLLSQEKTTGLMMMFAMRYSLIIPIGTLLCIATIITITTAKSRYHISVKKPILTVIYSALMIYMPVIAIGLFMIVETIFAA